MLLRLVSKIFLTEIENGILNKKKSTGKKVRKLWGFGFVRGMLSFQEKY